MVPKAWKILDFKVLSVGHAINVIIGCEEGVFGITNVYTPSNSSLDRALLWDNIKDNITEDKWIVCRDFNMIINKDDKYPAPDGHLLSFWEEEAWEDLCSTHGLREHVSSNSFT